MRATPVELTLAGWPLPDNMSHIRVNLMEQNKWDINPLALYDEADEEKHLILPQKYETLLRGATVYAAFHLVRCNLPTLDLRDLIGSHKGHINASKFNLEVKEITILKKPDPSLAEGRAPTSKKRKLAGPSWLPANKARHE